MLCELPDVVVAVEATLLVGMGISVEATDVVVAVEATLLVGMGIFSMTVCDLRKSPSYFFRNPRETQICCALAISPNCCMCCARAAFTSLI